MSYGEFCAGIAARDGTGCFIRRVLEARRDDQLRVGQHAIEAGEFSRVPLLPKSLLACDGEMDGHHLLQQQFLKREFRHGVCFAIVGSLEEPRWHKVERGAVFGTLTGEPPPSRTLDELLSDPRNGVGGCRRHHDLVTRGLVRLFRDELPECVFEFAAELGVEWRLERDYPAREIAA